MVSETPFADSLQSMERKSLSSSIMDLVTDYLLSGGLKPGDRLPTELEFARRLGVGRNSVREAMKMLSSVGVVEIRRGSGTYISDSMSSATIHSLVLSLIFQQRTSREVIELRLLLDTASAELAMKKAGEQEFLRLEEANRQLGAEAEKANPDGRILRDLDLRFHRLLYELSGNRLLATIGQAVYTMFLATIEKAIEHHPRQGYLNHERIIAALKTRDPDAMRKTMWQSLEYWMTLTDADEA